MLKEKWVIYSIYVALFAALYFIFFQRLDAFHIRNWDEAMFATNAYEMNRNHDYIVPHYKNVPDIWNSKPPLQIWLQVLFIKLTGYNELAIRLPSALASSFSALLLFIFFKKRFSLSFAACVFFVFVTSTGVSTFHTGRTGDSDALLSFFILCYCLSFYKWLFEGKAISLLYFFIFLTLAVLTKSVAALLFLPAFLFLILYHKKAMNVLSSKWLYIGFIPFIILSFGYFLLRDHYQPGYLEYVLNNDVGRITSTIESHKEPFDFYFIRLFENRFLWFILVIPGAFAMWINKETKHVAAFFTALLVTYFLIISYSTTKLEWYDLPLFPILSVFSAFAIHQLISNIQSGHVSVKNSYILALIFIVPLYFSCRTSYKSEINPEEKKQEALTEYAFKNMGNASLNHTLFYTNDYDRGLLFYKYRLNEQGMDFKIVNSTDSLQINDVIVVADDSLKSVLLKKFDVDVIDSLFYTSTFKIKASR
jgi:4-amino-4-deoxy-L-arabinose transferase-like glycosyltransferase